MKRRIHPLQRVVLVPAALVPFLACANPYPAVLTSTADKVAIEFEKDGNLADTSKLAAQECAKVGKEAEFDSVDMTATPSTRIARYNCVSDTPVPAVAAPPPSTPPSD